TAGQQNQRCGGVAGTSEPVQAHYAEVGAHINCFFCRGHLCEGLLVGSHELILPLSTVPVAHWRGGAGGETRDYNECSNDRERHAGARPSTVPALDFPSVDGAVLLGIVFSHAFLTDR